MRSKTRNALLLSGLSFLAALAAAGVAKAWGDVPDHVDVAPQLVGDAGQYDYLVLGKDGEVELQRVATSFRWLPPTAVRDAAGELRTANALAVDRRYYADDGNVYNKSFTTYIDPVDRDEDIATVAVDGEIDASPLVPLLPMLGESVDTKRTERFSIPDPDNGGLEGDQCGQWPLVGGQRLDLRRDVRLMAPCLGPLYWSGDLGDKDWFLFQPDFRAVRMADVGGRQAIVFQSEHYDGKVWAWLDPEVPYPLQVTHERGGKQHVLRLVRFERGDAPLADRDVHDAPTAPRALLAPRQPWGMDDAGVDHPFPLSTAWTYARDDPLASGMRDWIAAHPDWYTADARGRVADYGDTRIYEWKWVLTDGVDQMTVGLVRQEDRDVPPGLLPLEAVGPRVSHRYENSSIYRDVVEYPSRDKVAPRLPTVASLEAQWRAYSGTDAPLDGWGFRVWCISCTFIISDEWVGQFHYRGEVVGGGPLSVATGMDLDYDIFQRSGVVHEGGEDADPNFSVTRIHRDEAQLVVAGVPLSQQAPATPPQGIVLGGDWMAPGPVAVAAAGAVALLVFLAVRFGGPLLGVPLFSRIQGPALLEHPVRKAIHQAVEANPGIHLKALARTLGRPRNTVEHHARKLVADGLLAQHMLNGYACLFVKGQVDRREQAAAGVLKSAAARKVLAAVVQAPGASGRDVAAQAGLTPTLVSYHVRNLQEAGLLEGQKQGRELRLQPTELGRKTAAAAAA